MTEEVWVSRRIYRQRNKKKLTTIMHTEVSSQETLKKLKEFNMAGE